MKLGYPINLVRCDYSTTPATFHYVAYEVSMSAEVFDFAHNVNATVDISDCRGVAVIKFTSPKLLDHAMVGLGDTVGDIIPGGDDDDCDDVVARLARHAKKPVLA